MNNYQVLNIGSPNHWRAHFGGFRPESSRQGRRVINQDLDLQYIGLTANALQPGEEAGYWHSHSRIEEVYLFLSGEGEMGLDEEVVSVTAGSVVRVGQGVRRTWRCTPQSPGELRWLCIRAGGDELARLTGDSERDERPMPW